MFVEHRQRLDAIGFEWDPLSTDWEHGFTALENFKAREGHCRVPRAYVEDGLKLGIWVSHQRQAGETMSTEHRQRLEAIGFDWCVNMREEP